MLYSVMKCFIALTVCVSLVLCFSEDVAARALSIQTTTAQRNAIAKNWKYYQRGYQDYNCLAYALGNNRSWVWPWGSSPSVQTVKNWLSKIGYANAGANTQGPFYKYIIYVYEKNGVVTHFARTTKINGSSLGGNNRCVAKWGSCELFTHTNSNPYDYIEDNEHYDSLVNKGVDALPILEEKLVNNEYKDGLMAYVTAMAIEDISGCDTHANQNATWSTADEFIDYWEDFTKTADQKVEEIVNSNVSDEKKIDEMKKYGIFSVPAMQDMKDGKLDKKALEKKKKTLKSYGISTKDNAKVNKIKKYMKGKAE